MASFDFQQIHDEFRDRVFHYLFGMVGKSDAEDLTQVVFEKINRNLSSFREESSLATWIYRIATNVALDNRRSASSRQTIISLDTIEDSCDCDIFGKEKHLDAESGLMRREMNTCIHRIIKRMPENERVVLLLREFEGMKNREIAEILDITLDAVKTRLHRARTRLRKNITTECSLYHDQRNELVCTPK
ncbi:MAG: RNA polymerase subunit sigma-24 [Deltaproteobacteria bacterium HGW-Deltaproteobacteria-2]|jgi:RNA polymerase sigma-70 factor (ECF subfamily)|nr:MAG: RNA polymerase subunit sigma-24 [Deltaproteobacteria bacterium HGW-Deltaproteobacteria-2]